MITDVNEGLCHRRVQEGKPTFFVNWKDDGEQKYFFHQLRSTVYRKYQELLKLSSDELHNKR